MDLSHLGLTKNSKGRVYKNGVADRQLWGQIYDINQANHGLLSQKEIADKAHCSPGLVSKVFNSTHLPLHQSEYRHRSQDHTFDDGCQYIMRSLLEHGTPA